MPATQIITVALVFLLGLAAGGAIIWFLMRRQRVPWAPKAVEKPTSAQVLAFRFSYVAIPVILTLLSLALTLGFYAWLPVQLAYRFDAGGTPSGFMNRDAFILVMFLAQLVLVAMGGGITLAVVRLGQRASVDPQTVANAERFLKLLSNMIVLPQLILLFIALDASVYGVWQLHLMPVRLFVILAIALGSLVLAYFFVSTFKRPPGGGQTP